MASFFFNLLKGEPTSPSLRNQSSTSTSSSEDSAASTTSASSTTGIANYCGVFDLNAGSWTQPSSTTYQKAPNVSSKRNHPFSEMPVAISHLDQDFSSWKKKDNTTTASNTNEDAAPPQTASSQSLSASTVRIVVISDTHQYHDFVKLPKGDILIHCGDILMTDRFNLGFISNRYSASFFEWFNSKNHDIPVRLFCCGNHDAGLEQLYTKEREEFEKMIKPAIFLNGDEVFETSHGLRIFGGSYSTKTGSGNQAFQSEEDFGKLERAATHQASSFSRQTTRGTAAAADDDDDETNTKKVLGKNLKVISSKHDLKNNNNNNNNNDNRSSTRGDHIDILVSHCNLPKKREVVQMLNPGLHLNGHYHAYHGLRRGYTRLTPNTLQQRKESSQVSSVTYHDRFLPPSLTSSSIADRNRVTPTPTTDSFFRNEIPNINAATLASLSGWNPRLHPPVVVDVVPKKKVSNT